MKVTSAALGLVSSFFGLLLSVEGHTPDDIIHTCSLIDKSEPTGPYEPYSPADGPRGHVHIIFGDVNMDETPGILDILKEKENTKVTFFTHTDKMDKEGVPELMKRIIVEGHTIGSMGASSDPQINFLYANNTYITDEVSKADAAFKEYLGFVPTLYQPSFGALDTRGYEILKDMGKTIVMWSAGANGWWFIGNDEPIETTVAALRYTVPEAGGILELPTNAAVVEAYLDDVWPYWDFVDFKTCTGHEEVHSSSAKANKSSKVSKSKAAKTR